MKLFILLYLFIILATLIISPLASAAIQLSPEHTKIAITLILAFLIVSFSFIFYVLRNPQKFKSQDLVQHNGPVEVKPALLARDANRIKYYFFAFLALLPLLIGFWTGASFKYLIGGFIIFAIAAFFINHLPVKCSRDGSICTFWRKDRYNQYYKCPKGHIVKVYVGRSDSRSGSSDGGTSLGGGSTDSGGTSFGGGSSGGGGAGR